MRGIVTWRNCAGALNQYRSEAMWFSDTKYFLHFYLCKDVEVVWTTVNLSNTEQ